MKQPLWLVRTISSAVLIPLALGAVYVGGCLFSLVALLVLGWAALEFVRLMERGGYHPALLFTWGFVFIGWLVAIEPSDVWLRPAMTGLLGGSLVWQMFQPQRIAPSADWALTVAGGLYIGWMGGHLVALRQVPEGLKWTLLPLLITWCADSGAYLVGSNWGRRKLAPRLSPGKTWEGTVGGWLTGVIVGGILAAWFGLGAVHGAALGVLLGIVSPLGDLGVSMFKRQVGAKDSSHLIPGHGGMLDRIDSLLFTVAISYYYVQWVIFVQVMVD